jgi:hypothetical protein
VLSRIGQTQPLAMTAIFIVSPMPANSMMTGTSTGGGTARRNSRTGSHTARTRRYEPMTVPRATPATAAHAYPADSRSTLGSTSSRSRSPVQTSGNVVRIVRSGGQ